MRDAVLLNAAAALAAHEAAPGPLPSGCAAGLGRAAAALDSGAAAAALARWVEVSAAPARPAPPRRRWQGWRPCTAAPLAAPSGA